LLVAGYWLLAFSCLVIQVSQKLFITIVTINSLPNSSSDEFLGQRLTTINQQL